MAGSHEQIEGPQHAVSGRCQLRTATAAASDCLFHQRRTGEVAKGFDGLPGSLVTNAGTTRRF